MYDVFTRTAKSLGTDHNGALRYLMEAPAVPATPTISDDDED